MDEIRVCSRSESGLVLQHLCGSCVYGENCICGKKRKGVVAHRPLSITLSLYTTATERERERERGRVGEGHKNPKVRFAAGCRQSERCTLLKYENVPSWSSGRNGTVDELGFFFFNNATHNAKHKHNHKHNLSYIRGIHTQ